MTERFKTSTARKGGRLLLRVIDETETASPFCSLCRNHHEFGNGARIGRRRGAHRISVRLFVVLAGLFHGIQ